MDVYVKSPNEICVCEGDKTEQKEIKIVGVLGDETGESRLLMFSYLQKDLDTSELKQY